MELHRTRYHQYGADTTLNPPPNKPLCTLRIASSSFNHPSPANYENVFFLSLLRQLLLHRHHPAHIPRPGTTTHPSTMATDENSIASVPNSPREPPNPDEIPSSQIVPLSWVLNFSRQKDNEIKNLRQQLDEANTLLLQAFVTSATPHLLTHTKTRLMIFAFLRSRSRTSKRIPTPYVTNLEMP
jgi:hypothetical protein